MELYRQYHDEIDLVILDMIMPAMRGGVIFDALKNIHAEAKVILSSGYSLDDKPMRYLNEAAEDLCRSRSISGCYRKKRDWVLNHCR